MQEQKSKVTNLLNDKLELTLKIKDYTQEMFNSYTSAYDENLLTDMLNLREDYASELRKITLVMQETVTEENYSPTSQDKSIKKKIQDNLHQIIIIDKNLREIINGNIKEILGNMNKQESKGILNIKA